MNSANSNPLQRSSSNEDSYPTFTYPMMIREHHLDAFGHVNHAKYLEILEEARWQIISERGYGLKEVIQTQLAPVILSLQIKYVRELTLREDIKVVTEVIDFSKRVGQLKQQILKPDGTLAAEAEIAMGIMDLQKRKLVSPNDAWRHALGL